MYPVHVSKVTAALGGIVAVGCGPLTLAELSAAVDRGLPGAVVASLAANAAPDDPEARRRLW